MSLWNLNDAKKVAATEQRKEGIAKVKFVNGTNKLLCALDNGTLEVYTVNKK